MPLSTLELVLNFVNAEMPSQLETHTSSGLTVGSACSGWCSELFALQNANIRRKLSFVELQISNHAVVWYGSRSVDELTCL